MGLNRRTWFRLLFPGPHLAGIRMGCCRAGTCRVPLCPPLGCRFPGHRFDRRLRTHRRPCTLSRHPWDLATALSGPEAVLPGSTILLHGGVYPGGIVATLEGTADAPSSSPDLRPEQHLRVAHGQAEVLHDATEHHPAQTQMITDDVGDHLDHGQVLRNPAASRQEADARPVSIRGASPTGRGGSLPSSPSLGIRFWGASRIGWRGPRLPLEDEFGVFEIRQRCRIWKCVSPGACGSCRGDVARPPRRAGGAGAEKRLDAKRPDREVVRLRAAHDVAAPISAPRDPNPVPFASARSRGEGRSTGDG